MIRTTAFALSLVAIAAAPVAAQGIAVVGGVVSSSYTVDPATAGITYSGKTGFVAGLSLSAGLANGISIGPELLYAQKGSNLTAVSGGTTYTGWDKVAYIEVPFLVRIGLGTGSTRFFVTGGAQFSYRLSCTISIPTLSNGVVVTTTGDCDTQIASPGGLKTTDYGVVVGAGVSMGKISISARYDLGMANVNKDPTAGAETIKNKAIMGLISITP